MLSKDEIHTFARDGVIGPYDICSVAEMDAIRQRLNAGIDHDSAEETIASQVTPHENEGGPLRTLYDRHLADPDVRTMATHPQIVERAKQLLGDDLVLWRSTFWIKQPFSRRLEWHQDTYKDEGFGSFANVNAWIAIDEATEDNGVQLVAGTHTNIIDRAEFRTPAYIAQLERCADLPAPPVIGQVRIITMAVKPGQGFLFDGRVLHGSPPNRSPQRRAGMVARFIPRVVRLNGLQTPLIPV